MPIDFTVTLRIQKCFPKAQNSPCCGGSSHKATKGQSSSRGGGRGLARRRGAQALPGAIPNGWTVHAGA